MGKSTVNGGVQEEISSGIYPIYPIHPSIPIHPIHLILTILFIHLSYLFHLSHLSYHPISSYPILSRPILILILSQSYLSRIQLYANMHAYGIHMVLI